MFESALPSFHGIASEDGIPVQAVKRKTTMIDRGEQLSDANAVDMSLRAEFQARQFHGDPAFDAAGKNKRGKIGNVEAVFVETIAAGAAQSALMENIVGQQNVGAGIVSDAFEFAIGVGAFAVEINFAGGRQRRAERFAEVHQIDPSAVAVFPVGLLEIGHFGLQVEARSADSELALLDGEAFVPYGEFGGCAERQRDKTLVGELYIFPVERSGVERVFEAAAGVEGQLEITAFEGQRALDIVVKDPAVREFEVADA